jgi:transposase-like protein
MSDPDRVKQMMEIYSAGATLRQVAQKFDISHERVRQLFENRDPAFTAKIATKREQAKVEERAAKERMRESERKRPKGTCRICGDSIYRPRAKYTCSPEHQQIWNKIKLHIDPDIRRDHIVAEAKVIKASEAKYTKSQVKWANRVLSNDESVFKPHAFVPQSDAYNTFQAWKKKFGHKVKVPDSRD